LPVHVLFPRGAHDPSEPGLGQRRMTRSSTAPSATMSASGPTYDALMAERGGNGLRGGAERGCAALKRHARCPISMVMRQVVHKLVGVACWILIGVLWVMLVRDGRASSTALGGTAVELAALSGVVLAVTIWWVRHNVGIYRRKGPRQGRASTPPRTDEDRLGRALCWSLAGGALAASRAEHLIVEVNGDVKTYRRGD
jgi:hypothetical protein